MQKLTFYAVMLVIVVLPVLMIGPQLSNHGKERLFSVVFPARPSCTGLTIACGPPQLIYREFILTADANKNAFVLRSMQQELQRIRKTEDRHNGIRIRIDDATPFQDYITGLSICKSEAHAFIPLENDVYAPYGPEYMDYFLLPDQLELE